MIEIEVRLVGLGHKTAGIETGKRKVIEGETLLGLWRSLKAEAKPGSLMTRVDVERVLIIYNGKPCCGEERLREAVLSNGDKAAFMLMVIGG